MIIYIASPYSSYVDKQAAVNVQIDAFAKLRDLGHEPIAPLLSHYIDQRHPASYERWMQWCLAMVRVSDVLLRLPGDSDGADREVAEAKRLGKPVVHGISEIAPYKLTTGGVINGEFCTAVSALVTGCDLRNSTGTTIHSLSGKNIEPVDEPNALTVADLMKDIVDVPGMSYTWAEFQAANQQALDDIAAFVGGTRE